MARMWDEAKSTGLIEGDANGTGFSGTQRWKRTSHQCNKHANGKCARPPKLRNEVKGHLGWHVCAVTSVNLSVGSEGKACSCNVCWCGGGEKEGGREEKTTRRVYHQVRVRRERQAERLVWASVRETRKTAVLWTAVKIIWSLPWIRNTCLNLTDLYSISCELSQRPLKVPRCFRNILGFKPASIVQKCVL